MILIQDSYLWLWRITVLIAVKAAERQMLLTKHKVMRERCMTTVYLTKTNKISFLPFTKTKVVCKFWKKAAIRKTWLRVKLLSTVQLARPEPGKQKTSQYSPAITRRDFWTKNEFEKDTKCQLSGTKVNTDLFITILPSHSLHVTCFW